MITKAATLNMIQQKNHRSGLIVPTLAQSRYSNPPLICYLISPAGMTHGRPGSPSMGSSFRNPHWLRTFHPLAFQSFIFACGKNSQTSLKLPSCATQTNTLSSASNSAKALTLCCATGGSTYQPAFDWVIS